MERNNMKNLQKDFVPYELSLKMKQLGFDEPCFGRYYYKESYPMLNPNSGETELVFEFGQYIKQTEITILAPLYQQCFRWFREKYNLKGHVEPVEYLDGTPDTYHWSIFNNCNSGNDQLTHEEAELACLEKLCEIVEQK